MTEKKTPADTTADDDKLTSSTSQGASGSDADAKPDTNSATKVVRQPRSQKPRSRSSNEPKTGDGKVDYIDLLNATDKASDSAIIKLFQNDDIPPNGQPFGVNGRFFALKADVWYRVPAWLLSTIDNSIYEKPVTDDNNRFVGTRPQPRFPYTVRKD